MKKIILALACAVSVIVAKASDSAWFSGSASGTQLTATNAAWSQPDSGVEVAKDVITLDLDTDAALTLTPTENSAPDAETKTSVTVTANFYPNALEDLDDSMDAQTALAVAYETEGGTLRYYAWDGSDWVALSGVVPVAAGATEVTAKIELDYYREGETKARFTIGSSVLTYTDDKNGTQTWLPLDTPSRAVNNVEFAGSGKLKSVASTVELGVASVDGVKYPTYAAAIEAADGSQIVILRESETETLGEGALANYKASVVDNVTYLVAKVYVAQIGDTKYETLADAVAAYTTGSSIIVLGETVGDIPAGWKIDGNSLVLSEVEVELDDETPTAEAPVTVSVAVPQVCKANELIDTENRAAGDILKVWSKTDKCYYTWELTAAKKWEPKNTYVITETGATTHSKAASEFNLMAGQAVWVTITTSESVKLKVAYNAAPVAVSVDAGWNLVAPTTPGDTTVTAIIASTGAADNDSIVVPTKTVPKVYTKVGDKWGYTTIEKVKTQNGLTIGRSVHKAEDTTIKAGTGVWFVNGSNNSKNINL